MDTITTVALVIGVILGALGGYAIAWQLLRTRQQTDAARGETSAAQHEAYLA